MMDSSTPCARLCHITKWDDFDGYGFNLHAEKGRSGQFIGKVDDGSPSEAAGLRQGDRIIEVNEISIAGETHKQVVERIKAFPNETKLLVVDQQADDYYKTNNIVIKGTMPGIRYLKTPERSVNMVEDEEEQAVEEEERSMKEMETNSLDQKDAKSNGGTSDTHSIASSSSHHENGNSSTHETSTTAMMEDTISNKSSSSSGVPSTNMTNSNGSTANGSGGAGLNLAMSAKELRAKLAMKKKYDPKKESMGFKDKFDIVQKL